MKYKCIVVEDNILERDALLLKLKKIGHLNIVAVFSNGLEALPVLKSQEIDIVFSDIDMPDLSGIELLRSLRFPPVFIFISAHRDHAAESFELDVIDYIIKPVKTDRLLQAIEKATEHIKTRISAALVNVQKTHSPYLENPFIHPIDPQDYFFVKENNAHVKIFMGEVLYIESMGDFSKIMLVNQKFHTALIGLKNLEIQLPDSIFMRIHKQYIINVNHIRNIATSDITLSNNSVVPMSVLYKQTLLDTLVSKKTLNRFID